MDVVDPGSVQCSQQYGVPIKLGFTSHRRVLFEGGKMKLFSCKVIRDPIGVRPCTFICSTVEDTDQDVDSFEHT